MKCSATNGYLMSPTAGGARSFSFSKCSKDAISTFLRLSGSACLKTNTNPEVVVLPSNNIKLPGELLNGAEFCKKYFSTYKNVAYIKRDSDLRRCRLRCQLGPRSQTFKDALDGTPCDSTRPEMKCKEGACKQW
nr:uncharacterized protein LOC129380341 [Dermacentor andersoni]